MSQLIQIFEYQKLKATDTNYFPNEEAGMKIINQLWQYNDSNNNIYFEAIRNGVKFKNYVGVIQIGKVTIEILPKADKHTVSELDKVYWHNALLKMLAVCKRVKVDSVSEAALKKRYHSLLDLYFELFLQEVNYLLEQGLIKNYRKQTDNLKVYKGGLNFAKHLQKNLIHKERFYTSHQVYDHDQLINQILFKALLVLNTVTNSSYLSDSIVRTLSRFPEISIKNINKTHFDQLIVNRKTNVYDEAIKISKMILLNYSPDIKGGRDNMIALLFDMNKLWEEYIYRKLAKLQTDKLKVKFQNRKRFWEKKVIKPDIVLTNVNITGIEETFVIDTKWKIIDPKKPGDDDLKQMYVYNMYWQANKSMLLYPSSNPKSTTFGSFHKGKEGDNLCKLGFINVLDSNNNLDQKIGQKIIQQLEL